jgi:septal ring factor EnvC (AmiA/AmiB activator)
MHSRFQQIFFGIFFFMASSIVANEFIVPKKSKAKKETAAQVKEDVAELLESALRQLNSNIGQAAIVQNKIFDQIKELLSDNELSTDQLRQLRTKLEKYLQRFEEQQADLHSFLLDFK